MKIRTDYWAKPIPLRCADWSAVDDDTYDGPGCPMGFGATEQEAIADLMERLDERGICRRCGEPNPEGLDRDGCRDPQCPEQGR